ncbi:MAG: squalene/phytoene synthase family protein [Pacificimonas sp.]
MPIAIKGVTDPRSSLDRRESSFAFRDNVFVIPVITFIPVQAPQKLLFGKLRRVLDKLRRITQNCGTRLSDVVKDLSPSPSEFLSTERFREVAPARYFASLFVETSQRSAFQCLHSFDLRLVEAQSGVSEPHIALIKLAWWRDAVLTLSENSPPAEPLLKAVSARLRPQCFPALAELASTHMRAIDGEDGDVQGALEIAWAAHTGDVLTKTGRIPKLLRPITALRFVRDGQSPTRMQMAIVKHVLTGR